MRDGGVDANIMQVSTWPDGVPARFSSNAYSMGSDCTAPAYSVRRNAESPGQLARQEDVFFSRHTRRIVAISRLSRLSETGASYEREGEGARRRSQSCRDALTLDERPDHGQVSSAPIVTVRMPEALQAEIDHLSSNNIAGLAEGKEQPLDNSREFRRRAGVVISNRLCRRSARACREPGRQGLRSTLFRD